MIKQRYTNYTAYLVSCAKYRTDVNGNASYKVTVICLCLKDKQIKVIHGTSNDYLRKFVTTGTNCYQLKRVLVDFTVSTKNKVVFTKMEEI